MQGVPDRSFLGEHDRKEEPLAIFGAPFKWIKPDVLSYFSRKLKKISDFFGLQAILGVQTDSADPWVFGPSWVFRPPGRANFRLIWQ